MTATPHRNEPAPERALVWTSLALQTLAVTAWLAAIGYEAGAPRTTIWPVPWIVVYVLGAAAAVAAASSASGTIRRWLGGGGAVLLAFGAVLRSLAGPADMAAAGVLRLTDIPLLLTLILPTFIVTAWQRDRLAALGVGSFLVWLLTLLTEYVARPNLWHGSEFYLVTGAAVPCALAFAAVRGGRFGATWTAGWYTGIVLVASVGFRALPAGAGPILPPSIPLLIVIPAVATDILTRWSDVTPRTWARALILGAIGPVFLVTMLAVHWPLAEWLLHSPAGLAALGTDQWPHHADPGHWQFEFWTLDPGARRLTVGLGLAALAGSASATLGRILAGRAIGTSSPDGT